MEQIDYKIEILRLKKEKNAIILAHYYQEDDIQDIADFLGDSLNLSQTAKDTDADIIVFCGVHFMAETAKILSPQKKVLLPVMNAGCAMADMIKPADLQKYKSEHPDTKIITYVNTTADVKALSDCICTSTNGIKIIKHYLDNGDKILYTPDQNLGKYAMKLLGKEFEVWDGCCPIHHYLRKQDILKQKEIHPDALIIAHPECQLDILEISDYVGSTAQLISFVKKSDAKEFIVCTEKGVLHPMQMQNPDKKFFVGSPTLNCHNMKKTRLEDVYNCLLHETNEVFVDENVRINAVKSLDTMLELSK
ncbi:MAG: quinolinate synthase NadA [Bacteroidales bacterium]|nr:quinolinate synthase NadA [Bacteroidales bacterium]